HLARLTRAQRHRFRCRHRTPKRSCPEENRLKRGVESSRAPICWRGSPNRFCLVSDSKPKSNIDQEKSARKCRSMSQCDVQFWFTDIAHGVSLRHTRIVQEQPA